MMLLHFASQLAKIESLRDKDSFSDLVRGLYLYGAKTVQPKALAKMIVSELMKQLFRL